MKQLKMARKSQGVVQRPLPEGCTVRNYRGPEDMQVWVDMCKCGIFGEDTGLEGFKQCITDDPRICPETDIYFVELDGKTAATITAVVDKETKIGTVHMVDSFPWARGRGIGSYMMTLVLNRLEAENMEWEKLSTDDWRLPAIKSYLHAGFRPVNWDADMEERWCKLLGKLDIPETEFLNEDFSFCKMIHAVKEDGENA